VLDQLALPTLGPAPLVPGPIFVCFELAGKPGHKGRHRARIVYPKGGKAFIHMYADPDTEASEKVLAEAGSLFMRGRGPTIQPVALLVHAFLRVPESWPKRQKEAALAHAILPTSRPDGDNYLKMAQDALNEIVWRDDSQVVDARIIKRYSDRPALRIEVREFLPKSELSPI
jgi:Holliday junction resolvase RusA-like endonuclease